MVRPLRKTKEKPRRINLSKQALALPVAGTPWARAILLIIRSRVLPVT